MNNVSPEKGRLEPWGPGGPAVLWSTNVGTGFSSISVKDGRIYTLGNRLNTDTVVCFDASTGELLWDHSYPASLSPLLYEGGPGSTPTVHEGRVYSLGKAGDLFCFDAVTGEIIWSKKLIGDFGLRVAEWGFAGSPLVLGRKLILNAGGQGMALDKEDGELIWLTDTNRAGYSTPIPTEIEGEPALIMFCRREVAAVTQESGVPIWSMRWQTQYDQNCTDPILYDGKVLVSSWTHAGTLFSYGGGVFTTNWQNSGLSPPLSPGVCVGRYYYAFHGPADSGSVITCVDLETGRTEWSEGGYPVGSIISVDNQLLVLCGNGALILAEASPEGFNVRASTYALAPRCWSMPAFSEGVLYARNANGDLVALEMAWTPEGPPPSLDIALEDESVVISWPWDDPLFQLESRPADPAGAPWVSVIETPALSGGRGVVTNAATGRGQLYRLRKE